MFRYIIEASLLHAKILNRTAIIPGYVYARACEFDIRTCGAFAEQVNRGQAVNSFEWNDLPWEQQQAWRIPIGVCLIWVYFLNKHNKYDYNRQWLI